MAQPINTKETVRRKFAALAHVMGWTTHRKNPDGSLNVGAVFLDYYAIGGGYRLHRLTANGGETDFSFRGRKSAKEMVAWIDACAWCRGYTVSEFNLPEPTYTPTTPISGEYFDGSARLTAR